MLSRKDIKAEIVRRGDSQVKVAKMIEVHPVNLNKFLNQETYNLNNESIRKLNKYLNQM